ncbi:flavodoxin family protein [Paenibacillus sp. GCM10027627]|uniref:flavodoxin family protein n=1 Tax=unclassified Paenibacillus TaxID=185978 RepID=UPI0036252A89
MPSSYPVTMLAICGSTRAGGNTDQALQYCAELARSRGVHFSILNLRDYRIGTSGLHGDCNSSEGPCEYKDDMPYIIERMIAADGLIYAVPVHGFGMSQLMQNFIERAGVCYLRFDRPLTNKVASAIITGRRYNHNQVYSQLISNFLLNRMIITGSGFPAFLHGGKPSDVFKDLEGMDSVRRTVHRMIDMIQMMKHYTVLTNQPFLRNDEPNERMIQEELMRYVEIV